MANREKRHEKLSEFLKESFTSKELTIFLTFKGFSAVVVAVQANTPADTYFFDVIGALDRFGSINRSFFDLLTEQRPDKADQIRSLAESWFAKEELPSVPTKSHKSGYPAILKYYACDRCEQRRELKTILNEHYRSSEHQSATPLVCIVHGDVFESQEMFLMTLRTSEEWGLANMLKSLKPSSEMQWLTIGEWPDGPQDDKDPHKQIWSRLPCPDPAENDTDMRERVQALTLLSDWTVVEITLWVNSKRDVNQRLWDCLKFWADLGSFLPVRKMLVVLVSLKYPSWRQLGFFRRLGRQYTNRRVHQAIDELRHSAVDLNLEYRPLPALRGVRLKDAVSWVSNRCPDCANLIPEINIYYDRNEITIEAGRGRFVYSRYERDPDGSALVPMYFLAKQLNELFATCDCQESNSGRRQPRDC